MSAEVLKMTYPVSRKEHTCQFCGGKIEAGTKYERASCAYDGRVYDWITHKACSNVASKLDMYYRTCDDGVDGTCFREFVDDYVRDNHYDSESHGIAEDWQLPYKELAEKILEELITKEIENGR